MRIVSSNIGMESKRDYRLHIESKTSVVAARVGQKKSTGTVIGYGRDSRPKGQTSWQNQGTLQDKMNEMNSYSGINRISSFKGERNPLRTVRESCMRYLISILYGEKRTFDYSSMFSELRGVQSNGMPVTNTVYYEKEVYVEETENTSLSTTGTVKCADGREINFNLELQMSRKFSAYYKENYELAVSNMCDPLVINLDGDIAQLDDQKFFFDIDADGVEDEISTLSQGSGYLALDKNGDGIINNGNELFGAKSGNGFSDLATYDSDGNGWIDENDEIWKKLLIWTKDENGEDRCYSLTDKKVGAICLSNASTDFSLNSSDNAVNGMIRKTGIFLYENGNVGTVQHLDVAR